MTVGHVPQIYPMDTNAEITILIRMLCGHFYKCELVRYCKRLSEPPPTK